MSKKVKQMEMDALLQRFQDVRHMVVLSVSGVDSQTDNQMRLALRKKNIFMQVVKNSLARRVFGELGMSFDGAWAGPTTLAWGAGSLAELSREIETLSKKHPKIAVKTAVSEGQQVDFKRAISMPTRSEAIARVIALALAPASRLAAQITAPAGRIASQVKTISEKAPEAAAPAPAAG